MTSRNDIDEKVAELERLLDGVDDRLMEQPKQKRKMPSWLAIVGLAAVIDLGARFFVPSSMPFVLLVEALIFSFAAGALILPVVRTKKLTGYRRKVHKWLAAAFALGAIRPGMWGFGVPVEFANLTIFLLGLAGVAAFYFRRKTRRDDEPDYSEAEDDF